ncbi:VanZ family protein [Paenibacillus sp. LHD-117]|uniref:VanZ family protein n=1 Tax=Paenibacillus sp. LHD-117 TaxID=3071412 RepID=UPI0027DF4BA1|nr:VanZ family protein [Paenibacillus sp. LHD-117]MDQ6423472.1 VanZ family protein [Paenibacillus sp. LHD-117]
MKLRTVLLRVLLAVYGYVLVKIILFKGGPIDLMYLSRHLQASLQDPLRIVMNMKQGNLIPFHEIGRTLNDPTNHGYVNLFGNIAIFAPFGLLQTLFESRRGIAALRVLRHSFFLSLFLELLQAIFAMGTFDVDDILLNTCGGLAGLLGGLLYVKSDTIIESPKSGRATD